MSDINEFWRLARKASFHFADDTTKEWRMGSDAESAAIKLLDEHPEWLPEVRANWGELWPLPERYRK